MHCLSGLAAREWSGQRVRLPLEPLTKTLCSSSHARRARSREGGAGGGSKLCAVCGVAGQAPLVGIPRGVRPSCPLSRTLPVVYGGTGSGPHVYGLECME